MQYNANVQIENIYAIKYNTTREEACQPREISQDNFIPKYAIN